MRLLHLALLALGCEAACVWLRTTGDTSSAWCVDKATGEEGLFMYENKEAHRHLNARQMHQTINRLYKNRKRNGITEDAKNMTMSASNFALNVSNYGLNISRIALPAIFRESARTISATTWAISEAVDRRLEQLRGEQVRIPTNFCVRWSQDGSSCIHWMSHHALELVSQEQMFAMGDECETTCKSLGDWCHYRLIDGVAFERRCRLGQA